MHAITLLGLLAGPVAAKALKYTVPSKLLAANCTMPADYTVSNFTVYTDTVDNTKDNTSFYFADASTGINTSCSHNSTSKPSTVGSNRWPCDDPNVAFIYQTTGVAGLTLIEVACPGNVPQFEASGLTTPDLACTNSTSGSTCVAKQSPIAGDFDSLQPAPQSTAVSR